MFIVSRISIIMTANVSLPTGLTLSNSRKNDSLKGTPRLSMVSQRIIFISIKEKKREQIK